MAHTEGVPSWSSYSYLFGPLVAFAVIAGLVVVLRWASRRGGSLVQAPVRPGEPGDYGMLVPVASPPTYAEGEVVRRTLEAQGVRATLAMTREGPRVLVFPTDAAKAQAALRRRGPARG